MTLSINGEVIKDADITAEIERMRPSYEQHVKNDDPAKHEQQLADWAKQNVIERTLLRQKALTGEVEVDEIILEDKVQEMLNTLDPNVNQDEVREFVRQQLLISGMLEKIVEQLPEASEAECKEFYQEHKKEFVAPESVHASHILKMVNEKLTDEQAKEAIENILDQVNQGADFGELANEHSDSPEGNGDLGYFTKGQMVPEFEKAAFETKPGQVSQPVRSSFGYHIIKVHDFKESDFVPFDAIEPQIKLFLDDRAKQAEIEKYIDGLRANAEIIEE